MKVFLTGGTGFVGKCLASALMQAGHAVTILTRNGEKRKDLQPGVTLVEGNPIHGGTWQLAGKEQDAVINLAGESIFSRWTGDKKKIIRDSRLLTTRNLVEAMEGGKVTTFFNASAVGYYGFHDDELLTEESPPGKDFLAQLAQDWETEALKAGEKGCRVVLTRFGIVLGEKGGALSQMIPLFKKYIGGPMGRGTQWFSWIHIKDLTRAFLFLLDHPEISGAVNFTSPNPVQNKKFAQALGEALNRPAFLSVPGFMLKLVLGEFGSVLLEGQRVLPEKLIKSGFEFLYPEVDQALKKIIEADKN